LKSIAGFQLDNSNTEEEEPMNFDEEVSCGFCVVNWGEETSSGE
jgi:hypothetical protein